MYSRLEIEEINPNDQTKLTKESLLFYFHKYDLAPFLYTNKIHISSDGNSQSHPVLTLSTKSSHYPERILSIFLHEQFHWWASEANDDDFRAALGDLKGLYPDLPKEGVSHSIFSTYLHLIICWLEFKATSKYLGESEAKKVILSFIQDEGIYQWIYGQVLKNQAGIEKVLKNHNLIPDGLI